MIVKITLWKAGILQVLEEQLKKWLMKRIMLKIHFQVKGEWIYLLG